MATSSSTATPMANSKQLQLLQCEVDRETESYFRILVDGKYVKYLTIGPNVLSNDEMCFAPDLFSRLPAFLGGDWNEAHVSKDLSTGQPQFAKTIRRELPGVAHVWHSRSVEYVDLAIGKKLRSNVYEATSSYFPRRVVAKFARFEWEIDYFDQETEAYQWVDGRNIGPRFLGHLTEEGRVIGFLMEKVEDARHPGPDDLDVCQIALSKLHALEILHGDVNKHNFLIAGGVATLIDFESAQKVDSRVLLQEEMATLPQQLQDISGRGGSQFVDADGDA